MNNSSTIDFILAGVGGQGTILATSVLSQVGLEAGYDVKQAEVHGMAQRGGSVSSHVRWGSQVHSPLIAAGEADILIAFEEVEAVRACHFLRPGGKALINRQAIAPITVSAGPAIYPDIEYLRSAISQVTDQIIWLPALDIARSLGNDKVSNVVLLGALSALLSVETHVWLKVIESRVPARYLQLNLLAFQRGRGAVTQAEDRSMAKVPEAIIHQQRERSQNN